MLQDIGASIMPPRACQRFSEEAFGVLMPTSSRQASFLLSRYTRWPRRAAKMRLLLAMLLPPSINGKISSADDFQFFLRIAHWLPPRPSPSDIAHTASFYRLQHLDSQQQRGHSLLFRHVRLISMARHFPAVTAHALFRFTGLCRTMRASR